MHLPLASNQRCRREAASFCPFAFTGLTRMSCVGSGLGGGNVRLIDGGRPNGSDVKLQAAFTRERTGGAPLAARKETFCLSDLQAA